MDQSCMKEEKKVNFSEFKSTDRTFIGMTK